jgi:tripartite-type tricarboxylate transporter receptor subunit TctC
MPGTRPGMTTLIAVLRYSNAWIARAAMVAVLTIFALTATTQAADWPAGKPIRIIAPSTAGGAADTFARVLADGLTPMLGATAIVENRVGGGGLVAVAATSQAEPDGYTLVISSAAYNTIEPFVSGKPGFDPQRGFTHIAYVGGQPNTFIVSAKSEYRSMADVINAAKAGRGIDFVSPGVGTLGHLLMESLAMQAGVKLQHIPHRGASQAVLDLVAGTVPLGTMTWGSAIGQIRAGTVRAVAVSSEKRVAEFPDVPTLRELGYDLAANSWFGLSGPPGLAPEIVARLNAGANEILARPEVRARFEGDAITSIPMTPAEFSALVAADIAKWEPAVKRLGLGH